jgi:acyl dehydratase
VLHRDQSFAQVRPIRAGDELDATLTVDSVKQAAGTDLVAISTRITDAAGEPVCTAYATLVHRG